jgi:hypothetical protein
MRTIVRLWACSLCLATATSSLQAAAASDLVGTWQFTPAAVEAVTAVLTVVPPDMPSDQVTAVSEALRVRLRQVRWILTASSTTIAMPDSAPIQSAATITEVDATTFVVAGVDAATGQARTIRLTWMDANGLQASGFSQSLAGGVQPAARLPDLLALERVAP